MGRDATILCYHAVADCPGANDPHALFIDPERFASQMEQLARTSRVVPLAEALEPDQRGGRPRVAITFDDGYRCLIHHAVPVLERLGLPATVFIPTGSIGDMNRWDAPSPCGLEIMSKAEMRVALAAGVSFESHGHGHIDLDDATEEERRADLGRSIEILTEITGQAPRFMAYPYGGCLVPSEATVEAMGFEAAFTLGYRDRGRFARARVPVFRWDPPWLFGVQRRSGYARLRYSAIGRALGSAYRKVRPAPRSWIGF